MSLKTSPFGVAQQVHWGSDIIAVRYDVRGLVVKIAREPLGGRRFTGLCVTFPKVSAFRLLDEVDLASYWSAEGFVSGYHVISVLSGGWSAEENERQGYVTERQEWMVVTGNDCLSVFASEPPVIEECQFDDKA